MCDYSKLDRAEVLARLFHPLQHLRPRLAATGCDFDCTVEENSMLGCRFHLSSPEAPTILYFHGNGETVGDYDQVASTYMAFGMNLLVATYRGYGWSTGSPTVSSMLNDCHIILEKALPWLEEQGCNGPLCVMGRSLGAASAIELASRHQGLFKAMIIESGFGDTLPLLKNLGIDSTRLGISEENGFRNCEKIAEVKLPTLILHGSVDRLILPRLAEKLQACSGARSKQFLLIPGAEHNTMIATGGNTYFTTIKGFIDKACGITRWGYKKRLRPQDAENSSKDQA